MILDQTTYRPSPVEIETRRRIKLSIYAYAYEYEAHSVVSDAEFDVESFLVDLRIDTAKPWLDFWFRAYFNPSSGMWIRHHPELHKIKKLYRQYYQ